MKTKKLELSIPNGYDKEAILEWVNPEDAECEVLAEFVNPYNYCLFVKECYGVKPEYRFYRIFVLGERTHISVDYDSVGMTDISLTQLAANYLNKKHGLHD